MYFIKKYFGYKCLQFLGRGGILFYDGCQEYYVDTENFVPDNKSRDKYGVRIFRDEIRFKNKEKNIPMSEKNKIASEVKNILSAKKIIATIE